MKILVIAPHMDDEVLGCGGAIARHVMNGDELFISFIAHRIYNHQFDKEKDDLEKQHAAKAKGVLGYKESVFFNLNDERLDACIQDIVIPLEKYILKIRPDIVYCPFRGDNNQDHRAVFDAIRVAARPSAAAFIKRILMYEVASSTEQSPPMYENIFLPNFYVNITEHIDKKVEAFRCYETEKRPYPHPRCEEALRVLAKKRGVEAGFEYAESFMILREKWD
ncbi:MAG: PIG-L family deacetylase [Candidatus Omnitrophota bacterium]|nr:MAG: PIG-L family deacetylase [Candidatus Omnitrophota bacterium]